MSDLIERLEKAEAGSGQLDDLVLKATGHVWHMDFGSSWYSMDGGTTRLYAHSAKVTTSLDAALALADRVLPGCLWTVGTNIYDEAPLGVAEVFLPVPRDLHDGQGEVTAPTPALAMCIAILKAFEAKPQEWPRTGWVWSRKAAE